MTKKNNKGYWIALYKKINDSEKLKQYSEIVTPIIQRYGGIPLVRGGDYKVFSGDKFSRTVIWEFPSFEKAIECHDSSDYQKGWDIAKNTTVRNLQIVKGFNTE